MTKIMLRNKWEERAHQYKNSIRGVLFRSLPDIFNKIIHKWHESIVCSYFVPLVLSDAYIVDIGAGYGRISNIIRNYRPMSNLVGLDFSLAYCQSYAEKIGEVVCADIQHLPFAPERWDGILAVTALMYIEKSECQSTVKQIVTSLKHGGVALFIDPGLEMTMLLRKLSPGMGEKTTGGDGFDRATYLQLFEVNDCTILAKGSNAFFTFSLPILLLIKKVPFLIRVFGMWGARLDMTWLTFSKHALHRWILIRRV
jgi:SAM-dependent methyltransferase